jgi:hypothetical protein
MEFLFVLIFTMLGSFCGMAITGMITSCSTLNDAEIIKSFWIGMAVGAAVGLIFGLILASTGVFSINY